MEVVGSIPQESAVNEETPMEPYYSYVARAMLDIDEVPQSLLDKLAYAEMLVKKVKPNGHLSSTQTIASIIIMWQRDGNGQTWLVES